MKPIGLYLHIPFCLKKCNYCDFASVAGRMELLPAYLHALETELALRSAEWPDREAATIFLGGGTPSLLPPEAYGRLMQAIRDSFPVRDDAEISLEANPGTVTQEKAHAMRAAGFNRISMGVQASQDDLLAAMGRVHRRKDALEAAGIFSDAGFGNLNVDLMFGLPGQTMDMWRDTLTFALSLPVTHLSCYSLSIEDGTPWGDLYRKRKLEPASEDLDRLMYHEMRKRLEAAGFSQYELSNFAKPGFSCRHNLIYWNRREYLGVGAGAHSLMGEKRFANTASPDSYVAGMASGKPLLSEEAILTTGEALAERMIMGMRLTGGLGLDVVSREFGLDVFSRYDKEIDRLAKDGLIEREGYRLRLTDKGLDLANQVFLAFV